MERKKETSLPVRSSPLLLGFVGILFSAFFILRSLCKSKDDASKSTHSISSLNDNHTLGDIDAESTPPPTQESVQIFRVHPSPTPLRKKIYEWSVAIGTAGLLVVNIFLMWSTRQTANIAAQSFRLTRNHTEDADEARCYITGPGIDVRTNIYQFYLSNSGNSTARKVVAHIEFSENKLPELEKIKVFASRDISQPELIKESDLPESIVLREIGKQDWDAIMNLDEALVMSGTIEYDNGFGRRIIKPFCTATVGDDRPNAPPSVNRPRCEQVPDFLRRQTRKWYNFGKLSN